ncbi:MAG: hypothetical protein ABIT16_02155 [Croceibacterium sp.]
MSNASSDFQLHARAPFHLWLVGLALVLWNFSGAAISVAMQTKRVPLDPMATAYLEAQPLWLALIADIAPLAGVAGAICLLVQSRHAARLFSVQLAVIVLANVYDLLAGTSLFFYSRPSIVVSVVLAALVGLEIAYARWLERCGVLY